MMALPPVVDGAFHVRVAERSPGTAATLTGGPGTSGVVTALDGADAGPGPATFAAATANW